MRWVDQRVSSLKEKKKKRQEEKEGEGMDDALSYFRNKREEKKEKDKWPGTDRGYLHTPDRGSTR